MNCSKCRAPILPQNNYCPSCGKGLNPAIKNYDPTETERCRKFMIFLAVYMMSEMTLLMIYYTFFNKPLIGISLFTDIIFGLIGFIFAGIPFAISFLLPKKEFARIFLMIIGSAYLLLHLGEKIHEWFFVEKNPFIHFQF